MVPYYITITLTAFFAAAAQSSRYREIGSDGLLRQKASAMTKFLLLLSMLPLIFTAGFRFYIGTDFGSYYKAPESYNGSLWDALLHFDEPGIILITKIVGIFTSDGAAYIFAFAFITLFFSLTNIYKQTNDYFFVVLLFIFTGRWHGCFNGVRQYLAAMVLLYSYQYVIDKKFIKFVLVVLVASLFHISAIVMLPLYFIMRSKLRFVNIAILTIGTILLSNNYDTIFSFIGLLKDKEMVMTEYATTTVNVLRVAVNCAPAILVLAIYWKKELNPKQNFYVNGLIINAAAMVAASNSAYLSRIGIFTGFFVPVGLAELVRFKNKQIQLAFRCVILVLFSLYWYVGVSQSSSLQPFHWVWNRP